MTAGILQYPSRAPLEGWNQFGYAYNYDYFGWTWPSTGKGCGTRLNRLKKINTIYIGEGHDEDLGTDPDTLLRTAADPVKAYKAPSRHSDGGNMSYLDGHVQRMLWPNGFTTVQSFMMVRPEDGIGARRMFIRIFVHIKFGMAPL